MSDLVLLNLIIFLPTFGAFLLVFFNKEAEDAMRSCALFITGIVLILALMLFGQYDAAAGAGQTTVDYTTNIQPIDYENADGTKNGIAIAWIDTWNIFYRVGYDGISVPLVLLTGFVCVLAMMASWSITKNVRGYLILFLILETGMMGVFLSLDFFLFYVFWEVMLLPMYFLIGVWGGPRKEYAAIKFFLYTLAGGVLMLIAMLMFYFGTGDANTVGTFNIIELTRMAATAAEGTIFANPTLQVTAFVLLFIGFAIKIPTVPFHTWLPDAHVEAPTPISMILAGVLLKMGGYGLIRIAFPLCPYGAQVAAWTLVALGAISIIYGAFAALAQTDFKRLVAYSSVSHMGYVLIGLAVWKLTETGALANKDYWHMGMNGAMFQMLAHGVSSAGMFFMVGVLYDRVHHRDLNRFGGIAGKMPLYTGLSAGIFFAGLGLPGLCGFIGEVFVVLSSWSFSQPLAIIAASGVILTAGYILWTVQRVYLGAEYTGPHEEALEPIKSRETVVAVTLLVAAIALGVYPRMMFDVMQHSTAMLVDTLDAGYQAAVKVVGDTVSGL